MAVIYKTFECFWGNFVDDSHPRFQNRSHVKKILEILNKQDPAKKYTIEFVKITNTH